VQTSPHGLIRLAGCAAGVCRVDLARDEVQDDSYWIRELVRPGAWPAFKPWQATPAGLQTLAAAPPEAFAADTARFGGCCACSWRTTSSAHERALRR